MKKTYISPAMDVTYLVAEQMIANSITSVGGNSGIDLGTDPPPADADVKGNFYGESIFD